MTTKKQKLLKNLRSRVGHISNIPPDIKLNLESKRIRWFFQRKATDANWAYAFGLTYWTIDEFVALSLGKNPEKVTWELVKPFVQVEEQAREYARRLEMTTRAVKMRVLIDQTPPSFIQWALQNHIDLPDELLKRLENKSGNPKCFRKIKNLNWEEVTLTLLRGDDIKASARNLNQRVPLSALNLISRRGTKKTNERFMLLIAWAQGGQVSAKTTKGIRDHVYKLRKSLKAYFGITTNPVHAVGDTYTPRFHLIDKRDAADKRAKERAERKTVSFDGTNLAHQGSLATGPASVLGETVDSDPDEYPFDEPGNMENDPAAEFLSKKRRD
jgi:hypothetical protein